MSTEVPVKTLAGAKENTVVIPGDVLGSLTSDTIGKSQLGPGLRLDGTTVVVCRAGVLRYRTPNSYWVDSNFKRV